MHHYGVCAFLILYMHLAIGVQGSDVFDQQVGTVYNIATRDLLDPDNFVGGKRMFKPISASCIITTTNADSSRAFTYYRDTSAFMSSVSTETSVSASVQGAYSFGATMNAQSSYFSTGSREASGTQLLMQNLLRQKTLNENCHKELDDGFKATFESLPQEVNNPQMSSSWYQYRNFLNTYGSHYLKGASFGALIKESTFAEQSKHYTESQFKMKACANAAGVAGAKKIKVNACFGFSNSQMESSSSFSMTNKINCYGGNTADRNKILSTSQRTPENIEKFLNSADDKQMVKIQLREVWEYLKSKYINDAPNYAKALNLQAFFTGFLGYDCGETSEYGTVLKQFVRYPGRYTANHPQFICQIASKGCHSDDDCHIGGAGSVCYCYGSSCVDYRTKSVANREISTPYVQKNHNNQCYHCGINNSCYYKIWVRCGCKTSTRWSTVWSSANSKK